MNHKLGMADIKHWSEERILSAIRRYEQHCQSVGAIPSIIHYRLRSTQDEELPSLSTIRYTLGSWNRARELAAGTEHITLNDRWYSHKHWSKDECVDVIRHFIKQCPATEPPSINAYGRWHEINREISPSVPTIRKCSSWNELLKLAALPEMIEIPPGPSRTR